MSRTARRIDRIYRWNKPLIELFLAALCALAGLPGCVLGFVHRYTPQDKLPENTPPITVVLVDGRREGEPARDLEKAMRSLFDRPGRFHLRELTETELASASEVTSTDAACALGRALGEANVLWTDVSLKAGPGRKCVETKTVPITKLRLRTVCVRYGDERAEGFSGEIKADIHIVDAREGSCNERRLLHSELLAMKETESEALLEAQRRAAEELESQAEGAFAGPPLVSRVEGGKAEIARGTGGSLSVGQAGTLLRDRVNIGTAVVVADEDGQRPAALRLLRGSGPFMPGDIFIDASAGCCLEFRPIFSTALMTSTQNPRHVAFGGGFEAEWAGPYRGILVGGTFDALASGADANSFLLLGHLGYQWKPIPQRFGVYARFGAGLVASSITLDTAGADDADIHATSNTFQVSGSSGLKVAIGDAVWINAEVGYRYSPTHTGWRQRIEVSDPSTESTVGPAVDVPPDRNINLSGLLFRLGFALRLWPY